MNTSLDNFQSKNSQINIVRPQPAGPQQISFDIQSRNSVSSVREAEGLTEEGDEFSAPLDTTNFTEADGMQLQLQVRKNSFYIFLKNIILYLNI